MTWHDVKEVLRGGGGLRHGMGLQVLIHELRIRFGWRWRRQQESGCYVRLSEETRSSQSTSLVVWREGLVVSGVGKLPCKTKLKFGKKEMPKSGGKWTIRKLRRRSTLKIECVCVATYQEFCLFYILHRTVWYVDITCRRFQLLQLLPWMWRQQVYWIFFAYLPKPTASCLVVTWCS